MTKIDLAHHISLRLLYCTINLTSRYNINRDKFAILNKLFNTKETFFNCVVGCLLVYSLLLWKYIINLVIEHCQNIFANLPLSCTYFWSISNFGLLETFFYVKGHCICCRGWICHCLIFAVIVVDPLISLPVCMRSSWE